MNISGSRQKNRKKRSVILIVSAGVVALLLASAAVYVYAFNGNLFGWQANQTKTVPEIDQGVKEEQVPDTTTPSDSQLPSKGDSDTPSTINPGTGDASTPPEKPAIERASGNPTLTVVASFQKASNGNCELQISKSGQVVKSYSANIVVSSSYYTCSFRVPRSEISSSSPWTITVIHHNGDGQTMSDGVEVS